jgi:hypothetical protein
MLHSLTTQKTNSGNKSEDHLLTCHEGTEGRQKFNSTYTQPWCWKGVGGPCLTLASLAPGGRLGGPWCQSGQVRQISPTPGFEPWTVRVRTLDCPARSESLYRLCYSTHQIQEVGDLKVHCVSHHWSSDEELLSCIGPDSAGASPTFHPRMEEVAFSRILYFEWNYRWFIISRYQVILGEAEASLEQFRSIHFQVYLHTV